MTARTDFEKITLEIENDLAILTLNKPDALNALCISMLGEMRQAIDGLANGQIKARALIMTGAGRGFSAGADLTAASEGTSPKREERDLGYVLEMHYHPVLLSLRNLPMPFVTAVNGAAAGAGMSFALSGDMIVAGESAYFLQAFRRIGLTPDAGASYLLPRLIGKARAMELSLLGEKLPATTAYEWGLINRVVKDDELMETARGLGRALADGPTQSLSITRNLYWQSLDSSYTEQLNNERVAQRKAGRMRDSEEGILAFLEKRAAKFDGT